MDVEAWNSFPEITSIFSLVTLQPFEIFNVYISRCWKGVLFFYTTKPAQRKMSMKRE